MDLTPFVKCEGEKPLDRIVPDGGLCSIFRTICCIGDSLASGEFESCSDDGVVGYHDYYDYSWGQYISRLAGCKVLNFSQGGMSAKAYCEGFANVKGYWDPDLACQGYIIALGVNDVLNQRQPIGTTADVNLEDYTKNADTFTGWYARIIQRVKEIQPKARIFLVTIPHEIDEERNRLISEHAEALRNLAEMFEFTYVIDLERYCPVQDEEYRRNFHMASHLNAAGYLITAKMMVSYIDYIIRNNPEDFAQVGFIGKATHHRDYKW